MNLLLSYAHIVNNRRWIPILELWSSKGLPLIIDSGAFTAMKSGVPIDHTAYIALAKLLQKGGGEKTTEFIQLDVIRDAAQSRANLLREYMASGITPNDFFGREGGRTSRSLISFLSSASWLKWARKVERNNQRFFFAAVEPFMLTQLLLGAIHNNRFGFNWPALKPEIRTLHDHLIAGNAQAVEPYLDRAIAAWKGFLVDG